LLFAGIGALLGDEDGPLEGADAEAPAAPEAEAGDDASDDQAEPGPTPPGHDGEPPPGRQTDDGPLPGDMTADDLDELIADLARDPDVAGRRGDRLLDKLIELRQEDAADRPEKARELMTEVSSWIEKEELEPQAARETVAVLEAVGRPDAAELEEASLLFAEVALDPAGWGKKGQDLLDDLEDLLGEEEPADWAGDAADIIEELGEWVEKDEIDPDRAGRARQILERLT
jgi:hypothetical protein